jgi:hypothetical protein
MLDELGFNAMVGENVHQGAKFGSRVLAAGSEKERVSKREEAALGSQNWAECPA